MVVAANAGGAWSPIGDVTTTMLWIQHKAGPGRRRLKSFVFDGENHGKTIGKPRKTMGKPGNDDG